MTTLKNDLHNVTDNYCPTGYTSIGKFDVCSSNIIYQVYTKKKIMGLTTFVQLLKF